MASGSSCNGSTENSNSNFTPVRVAPICMRRLYIATGNQSVDLYTILPSPILYGVWHTRGGSVRGRILRNSRAIVLQ